MKVKAPYADIIGNRRVRAGAVPFTAQERSLEAAIKVETRKLFRPYDFCHKAFF